MIKKFTQYILEKINYGNFRGYMSKMKVTIEVGIDELQNVLPGFACLIIIFEDDSVMEYLDAKNMKQFDSLDEYIQITYIGKQEDETLFDFYRGAFTSELTEDGDVTYTDVTNNPMYSQIAKNTEFPILRMYEVIDLDRDQRNYARI